MNKRKVYGTLLTIAKNIARSKEGALFVIAPTDKFKGLYDLLYPQLFSKHYLDEEGIFRVIEKLAILDGAVLISNSGEIVAYGAKIKKTKTVPGYGTKHAAAAGITSYVKDSTAILVSEEINWIKIFKNGKIVLEMDSEENPKSLEQKIISFLSEGDTALLTAAGVSAAFLGSAALIPVTIVGGTYLAIKTTAGVIKKHWPGIKKK